MNAARQSCERARLRNWLPVALIVAGIVWAVGLATPWGVAQRHAFFEDGTRWFCDYGFPRECAAAEQTYVPVDFEAKEACYPPLGYALVSKLPRDVRMGGAIFTSVGTVLFLASLALFASRATGGDKLQTALWCAAILVSAPMLLAINVANQILLAASGVLVFLAWWDSDVKGRRYLALLALAFASALKITPAIFSFLLLKRRAWKEFVVYGILSAALCLLPFIWFGGVDGIVQFVGNLKLHSDYYSLRTTWGFVAIDRAARIALQGNFESIRTTFIYTRLASALLGFLCLWQFFRTKDRAFELLMVVAALSFLPGPAQPYTALYFVPAMILSLHGPHPCWEPFAWFMIFLAVQLPAGNGSLNHVLAGAVFTLLISFRVIENGARRLTVWARQK